VTDYRYAETKGDGPLLFTFHGTGGDAQQFHGFGSQLRPGAHVISPEGDVLEHGARRFFLRTGEGVYDMADLALRTDAMAGFIAAQGTGEPALAFGYSNGANILASVAFQRPDLFDRVALLHPLIPFTPAPQPGLAGKAVLITAGRRDPICPAPLTQRLADWFDAQGTVVSLHWHAGGHEIAESEVDTLSAFFDPA
jgi:phospholipase/carboxylesterase